MKPVERFGEYICSETLATLEMVDKLDNVEAQELVEKVSAKLTIKKA